jgi:hypothetical protein
METQYILFINEQDAMDFNQQINDCMGWPSDGTDTWMIAPDNLCEFDLTTGEKLNIGYGIVIKDRIIDCLTEAQKREILILPSNINDCSWNPLQ